jgi:hypothetical protein
MGPYLCWALGCCTYRTSSGADPDRSLVRAHRPSFKILTCFDRFDQLRNDPADFFNINLVLILFLEITLPNIICRARTCSRSAASPPCWHRVARPPPAAPSWLAWQEVLQFNSSTLNYLNKIIFEFKMPQNLICTLYKVWTFHFNNMSKTKYYKF